MKKIIEDQKEFIFELHLNILQFTHLLLIEFNVNLARGDFFTTNWITKNADLNHK
mgnify:CR=1 FL=1